MIYHYKWKVICNASRVLAHVLMEALNRSNLEKYVPEAHKLLQKLRLKTLTCFVVRRYICNNKSGFYDIITI